MESFLALLFFFASALCLLSSFRAMLIISATQFSFSSAVFSIAMLLASFFLLNRGVVFLELAKDEERTEVPDVAVQRLENDLNDIRLHITKKKCSIVRVIYPDDTLISQLATGRTPRVEFNCPGNVIITKTYLPEAVEMSLQNIEAH